MDRAELMNRMAVLLGGRAAERLVFEEVSTGAADDLAKASEIARSMVVRFGMDPKLGQVAYEPETTSPLGMPTGSEWRPRHYGEQTAAAIDDAVRALIEAASDRALSILQANRGLLESAARDLLSKETMSGDDLQAVANRLGGRGSPVTVPRSVGSDLGAEQEPHKALTVEGGLTQ
jgi:cell division protease FtsH